MLGGGGGRSVLTPYNRPAHDTRSRLPSLPAGFAARSLLESEVKVLLNFARINFASLFLVFFGEK